MKHRVEEIDVNLTKISVKKLEIERERMEKYRVFKETMLEYYPKLKEDIIKKMFSAKFGYVIS